MGTGPKKTFARALGGSAKFSLVPRASAFFKVAVDCDGRGQDVGYTLCGAEVVADCYGWRQEMLDMLCMVDLAQAHQT